jgi:hypothetical protein
MHILAANIAPLRTLRGHLTRQESSGASHHREIGSPIVAPFARAEWFMKQVLFQSLAAGSIAVLVAFSSAPAFAKTAARCNADYVANRAAIMASGQTKKAYVAACRADTTGAPPASAPPETTAARAPMAPAPAPIAPRPQVGATAAGQFATDARARARCPSDTVVWVNTKSNIYHFAGRRDYGNTMQGAYMCEAKAKVAGDRAAKNEKHPWEPIKGFGAGLQNAGSVAPRGPCVESGAQIDFVAGEKVRRRLAILEGRNRPKGNARRRGGLEAGPIQALASLATLIPGHFAAFRSLTPAPPPFSPIPGAGRGGRCPPIVTDALSAAHSICKRVDGTHARELAHSRGKEWL